MPDHPNHQRVDISDEVRQALADGSPMVALETSGLIGSSYPGNLDMVLAVDEEARRNGALPVRIGVINGRARVGLSEDELRVLAQDPAARKLSDRDLAAALVTAAHGGTTVAASLILSTAVGIKIFAVAGIGGVHRGAQTSFDISADLHRFASAPSLVVCAGAKSLLDPALTLEYLETQGIPVIGYLSSDFPGYYTRSTGHPVPTRIDDLHQIAATAELHWQLISDSSVLVTHPIPQEWSIDAGHLNSLVEQALEKAASADATGAALTPFVLAALSEATDGRSVEVNRAVLKSTITVAAQLAVAHATVRTR